MILEAKPKSRNRKEQVFEGLCVFLVLAIFFGFGLWMAAQKSLTFDEPMHLVAGFASLHPGHVDLNPEHPPLVKKLAALPMRLLLPALTVPAGYFQPQAFLFQSGIPVDRLVLFGRGLCLLWMTLAGAFTYYLGKRAWGLRGAWIALALFVLCPNLMAHGALIHTDGAAVLGFVATVYAAVVYQQKRRASGLLFLTLALGFALATKFSGVLLLPYVFINLFFALQKKARFEGFQGMLHLLCLAAGVSLFLCWVYGSVSGPVDYWHGLNQVYANHDSRYALFMNGEFSREGFWLYYPFCLLVKVPVPTLLLFALAIPSWWILRVKQKSFYFHLFFPVFMVLGAGMVARHNIGIRHVLPIFPMLFVLAAGVGKFLKPLWTLALMPIVLTWLVFEDVKIFPDNLAYFNQWAGGPANGLNLLDDSNIDWGQDLKRLPPVLNSLGVGDFRLAYFGGDSATWRGLRASDVRILDLYLPNGDYVVSAQLLRRNTLDPQYEDYGYDWLKRYRPAAIIGHSLYVFRVRPAGFSTFKNGVNYVEEQQWRKAGLLGLETLVQKNPHFEAAQFTLSQVRGEM